VTKKIVDQFHQEVENTERVEEVNVPKTVINVSQKNVDVPVNKPIVVKRTNWQTITKPITQTVEVETVVEKPVEKVEYTEKVITIPVVNQIVKEVPSVTERIVYEDKINVVEKKQPFKVVNTKEVIEYRDKKVVKPVEIIKINEVEKIRKIPMVSDKIVVKVKDIPINRDVIKEKIKEVVIFEQKINEQVEESSVPIESVKINEVTKVVEKLERDISGSSDESGCISQAGFVSIWNRLMQIPFNESDFQDGCLDEDSFMRLITHNMTQNFKAFRQ